MSTGLIWFGTDLRVYDLPLLQRCADECNQMICVYWWPESERPSRGHPYEVKWSAIHRRFLAQTVLGLQASLHELGQRLQIVHSRQNIEDLIRDYRVQRVYRSRHPGYDEERVAGNIRQHFPEVVWSDSDTVTLWEEDQLPFTLAELPRTFSAFRRRVEGMPIATPGETPNSLPPSPLDPMDAVRSREPLVRWSESLSDRDGTRYQGGEKAGREHVKTYFQASFAQSYKQTRNTLDEWTHSTRFSAWLSSGAVSPRWVMAELQQHEERLGANESTGWIRFELLWREYFHWYARCHGSVLFAFEGIQNRRPLTSFYPERFRAWCEGRTTYPIVNACMKQLRQTGYLSNRGRQLVASCLVHELGVDWRYGASWFEGQLLDYDVALNWGNWQYLAGVGADPRGHRHFDLEKQTRLYDPERAFIRRWQGDEGTDMPMDSRDAADWPVAWP